MPSRATPDALRERLWQVREDALYEMAPRPLRYPPARRRARDYAPTRQCAVDHQR